MDASISYHTCETNILKEEEACGRHRPSEESTSPKCSLPLSEARMCLMARYKKRPAKEVESESDDESESEDEIEDEDLEIDHLSKKDKLKVIKLLKVISSKVNKLRKMEEKLDNQEDYLIKRIEELKALTEKHEKLKCSHATLVDRYAKASIELTCATNSISCVAQLEKANSGLKAQNEELASKYVALQENHGVLLCSHEKLVDSHAMLEIAHEVVLTTVQLHQPLTHKCTCSQVQIDLSCANPCCSQEKQSSVEHVLVESCDDLIAKENDNLKQEVEKIKDLRRMKGKGIAQPSQDNREAMVNKLEKGSTVQGAKCKQESIKSNHHKKIKEQDQNKKKTPLTCFKCKKEGHHVKNCPLKKKDEDMSKTQEKKREMAHVKCNKCSSMGHYASMCLNNKIDGKTTRSRRQISLAKRRCYGCKERGHKIESCPYMKNEASMTSRKRLTSKQAKQDMKASSKDEHHICYTC